MNPSLHSLVLHTFARVQAKDLDGMMSLFAEDAIVIDFHCRNPRMEGKAAITEGFRGAMSGMQSFGYTTVNYLSLRTDSARRSRRRRITSSLEESI